MKLTTYEGGSSGVSAYGVEGMPPGENAKIAHFNDAWRILRWNDDWHGNWTGEYATPEVALNALREELLTPAVWY